MSVMVVDKEGQYSLKAIMVRYIIAVNCFTPLDTIAADIAGV